MSLKIKIALAILFIFAIFILQNAQVVAVRFLFWQAEASRALVLLITFVLGLVAGWLFPFNAKRRVAEPRQNTK